MELNKITHGILDEIRKFTVTISGNRKFLNSLNSIQMWRRIWNLFSIDIQLHTCSILLVIKKKKKKESTVLNKSSIIRM